MDFAKPEWLERWIGKLREIRKNPGFSKFLTVTSIIYPLILIFLSRKEIAQLDWQAFLRSALVSLLVFYVSMALQNVNWSLIVDGSLKRFWLNSKVYFQTVLMKRLPGGVWHWLGRLSLYESNEIENDSSISSANFIEWLMLILTGLVVYLATVNGYLGILAASVVVLLGYRLFSRRDYSPSQALLVSIVVCFLYGVCWVAGGVILHWLIQGVRPEFAPTFQSSLALWSLSSAVGMVFFFFPSGALLRDFSLGALLTRQIEPAKVVLIILQVRLIFLAADFIWSFISLQFIKLIKDQPSVKAS